MIFHRHILAIIHFNSNLHREVRTSKNGNGLPQVKIAYPKFKNGNAAVRDVRVKQNFGEYKEITCKLLEEIFLEWFNSLLDDPSSKSIFFFTDYVAEIFETLLECIGNGTLHETSMKLKELVPPPMHSMLEKESRETAIERYAARKSMVIVEVPPTTPGLYNTLMSA